MVADYAGLISHIPGVRSIAVAVPADATWDHLGWDLPAMPTPVILVTGEGESSKAVIGLVDSSSVRVACVAKVPLGTKAVAAIAREARILERLNTARPGVAPRLLQHHDATGIAVQSMVEGRPSRPFWSAGHDLWREKLRDRSSAARSLSDMTEKMASRIDTMSGDLARSLESAMRRLTLALEIPMVWTHGDCAPWNLKCQRDGSLAAIDWEAADPHGLPGFDVVHFHTMQAFLFRKKRWRVERVRAAVETELTALDVDPGHAAIMISACLAEDAALCMEAGNLVRARYLAKQLQMLQNETMA